MDAPSAPPTPNPYAVAASQTTSNVSVAIANSWLANADVDAPDGSTVFTQNGTYTMVEPSYDKDGVVNGSISRIIPRFKQTITLSAKNQQIKDASDDVKLAMNNLAKIQTESINTTLSTSFNLNGVSARGAAPAAALVDTSAPARSSMVLTVGAGTAADRQAALDAINERLQWQIDNDRAARILKLECQGIYAGSQAYDREMLVFDRQSTDARTQAYLAATKELETRQMLEINRGRFINEAQNQEFQQLVLQVDFANGAALKRFQMLVQLAAFVDTQRQQSIQERVLTRSQSVNELSSLMSGGRIEMPQFAGFRPGHVDSTNVGQYVYQSAAMDQQKYNIQLQNQQALMGGLMSLGGALATAPMTGGGSLLGGFMGGMGR